MTCNVRDCERRESNPESAAWQDLFCNYRKYYVCRSWIMSQIMPLNCDKISAFCRKYPQIADVFPNKTHFLSLVEYREMKINENNYRLLSVFRVFLSSSADNNTI